MDRIAISEALDRMIESLESAHVALMGNRMEDFDKDISRIETELTNIRKAR